MKTRFVEEPFGDRITPDVPPPYSPDRPSDIERGLKYRQRFPAGTVPVEVEVLSVYDSRPINASDFNIFTPQDGIFSDFNETTRVLSFTVPAGHICVIRQLSWMALRESGHLLPWLFQGETQAPTWRLVINGNVPPGLALNANEISGIYGTINVFEIADESQIVEFLFINRYSSSPLHAHAHVYGNMLKKRGVHAPYEIAHDGHAAVKKNI